ncbi:MAG: RNA 2',3'-cyclic phosphodiesterase [Geobacter sp.]|nr:RNA 2',3'-cyclic phosphodiesterase [Geobacter sp.]
MHRLFVAIDLPEEMKRAVADLRGELRGAKWVGAEQLHLTLRFIGDADDLLLKGIAEGLAGIACNCFPLGLKGIGYFPPRGAPRVLWVGLKAGAQFLTLQHEVEQACRAVGILPDERPFSPHITIARLKETTPAQVAAYTAQHGGFQSEPFKVTEFHLYESVLGREGATHTRARTYPLRD